MTPLHLQTALVSGTLTRSFWFRCVSEPRCWGGAGHSDLAHGLGVDEVLVAPDAGVVVVLPLRVDVEVGEVVALRHRELLPHLVALLLAALQGGLRTHPTDS